MAETAPGTFEVRVTWTERDGVRCEGRWHRRSRARAAGLCQLVGLVASASTDPTELLAAAGPPWVLIRRSALRLRS